MQTFYRMHMARSRYRNTQRAAAVFQSAWRARDDRLIYTDELRRVGCVFWGGAWCVLGAGQGRGEGKGLDRCVIDVVWEEQCVFTQVPG